MTEKETNKKIFTKIVISLEKGCLVQYLFTASQQEKSKTFSNLIPRLKDLQAGWYAAVRVPNFVRSITVLIFFVLCRYSLTFKFMLRVSISTIATNPRKLALSIFHKNAATHL